MLHTLVPDLNVAPLKYAHVHNDHGGPIASLSARETTFLGRPLFEAFATLDEKVAPGLAGFPAFQGAHGRGTAASRPAALFAAISEALLLWAWSAAARDTALHSALRLDLDPSLCGFASFPGLGRHGARKRALFSAAASWAVREWWEGRLAHKSLPLGELAPGAEAIQILGAPPGTAVTLIHLPAEGATLYGWGAAHSALAAAESALERLERNRASLAHLRSAAPASPAERRLLHFSSPNGAARFRERLAQKSPPASARAPALLVDQPLLGPWTEYTHVWRCLFEASPNCEKEKDDYFYF